jgi:hypothetical protein
LQSLEAMYSLSSSINQQCPVRNLHVSVEYFTVSTTRRLQKIFAIVKNNA